MRSHAGPRLRLRRDGGLCSTGVAFSLWGWERGRMGTYGPQACGPRKKQKWSDESICVHLSFFCRENAHPLTTGGASPRTSHITRPSTHLAYSCPRPAYSAEGVRKKPRARSLSHSPQKKYFHHGRHHGRGRRRPGRPGGVAHHGPGAAPGEEMKGDRRGGRRPPGERGVLTSPLLPRRTPPPPPSPFFFSSSHALSCSFPGHGRRRGSRRQPVLRRGRQH